MRSWTTEVVSRYAASDVEQVSHSFGAFAALVAPSTCTHDPGTRTFSVAMSIPANSAALALEFSMAAIDSALALTDMPRRAVVSVASGSGREVAPPERAEPLPELVGAGEVLALLGLSKQRLHQLRAAGRFPAPAAELVSGPIWLRSVIEVYRNQRRPAGRPRRAVAEATSTPPIAPADDRT